MIKMKKILSTIACSAILATTASADFARIEMGGGTFMPTPTGSLTYTDGTSSGSYTSLEKVQSNIYAWMLVKHPIPVIPNLRLEYTTLSDEGKAQGNFKDISVPIPLDTASTLEFTQVDVIPYYNILDNTAWITLDLGLDIKVIESEYKVDAIGAFTGYNENIRVVMPLAYVRTRVQIPITEIGLEADVKYITYGGDTVYDVRVKVDYTLGFIPIIQPGLELGYRMQKYDISSNDEKTKLKLDFSGVYAGLMLRF